MSEGEAARSLADRRIKRSPLRDVAAMLRSFHYAAAHLFAAGATAGAVRREDLPALEPWARYWRAVVSAAFLRRYLEVAGTAVGLPKDPEELRESLSAYVMEKALIEIGLELDSRPDWLRIPLMGVLELMEEPGGIRPG
jgi:maltose alpha-D-glucosyltransferase/alpha-amylase